MANNAVGWFEIYVQDMARAKRFYESVLQVKLEQLGGPDSEMWSFPMNDDAFGIPGALVRMDSMPSGPGGTLVYFICADCAVEAARVTEAGGTVERPKMSIGEYGFIAIVTDTEGNTIGLHSMA